MDPTHSRVPLREPGRRAAYRRVWFESLANPSDALRNERMLGVLRGLLAALCLITTWTSPGESPQHTETAFSFTVLIAYAAFAAALLIYLYGTSVVTGALPVAVHMVDVCAAAALCLLSENADSAVFALSIFPLLAGATRWSLYEVLATALMIDVVIVTQGLLMTTDQFSVMANRVETTTLMIRAISIPIVGIMVGSLADSDKQRQREVIDLRTILRTARVSGEFDQTLALVLGSLVNTFDAATVLIALTDKSTGRMFLWRTDAWHEVPPMNTQMELFAERRSDYGFDPPGAVWDVRRRTFRRRGYRLRVFDESGGRVELARGFQIPEGFLRRHPCSRIVGMRLTFDDKWAGRLLVLDPRLRLSGARIASLALRISRELGPSTYGLYRVHRLRTRAQATERSRIARELHDGVTQSLLGVEMLIAVLRRRALQEAPALNADLRRIHDIVREDVIALREVIESGRAGDMTSGDPVADLEELVGRFQRHSGIAAKLVSDGRAVPLTLHVCGEVVRMVHEGLVNVRKHSGARHVVVRSVIGNGRWSVSLEDDGRGFPFGGRKTQAQLDERREGPRTMIDRAKRVGAEVSVESRPGSGSRVEITVRMPSAS